MIHEIRIHGRGGQGAVMASAILAQAMVNEGKFATAIPAFGFERRGAPVTASLRVDTRPIRRMTNITHPDYVLCIDPTVGRAVDIFAGIKPGATLVQATGRPAEAIRLPAGLAYLGLCDAVRIALEIFGKPLTNSVMLGAFVRTTGLTSLAALGDALALAEFRDADLAQNRRAIARGYEETEVHALEGAAAS